MIEYKAKPHKFLWQFINKNLSKLAAALRPSLGLDYNVYVAYLTQSGTDAPTATVLKNSIGDIVWTRSNTGDYKGTLTGAFPSDKRWATAVGDSIDGDFVQIGFSDADTIQIYNYDLLSPGTPTADDTAMYVEVRVYL